MFESTLQVSRSYAIRFQRIRNSETHHINSSGYLDVNYCFDAFALHFYANSVSSPDSIVKVVQKQYGYSKVIYF